MKKCHTTARKGVHIECNTHEKVCVLTVFWFIFGGGVFSLLYVDVL